MRLNKKQNILQLIQTINEGFDYAKNKGGIEAQAMIGDCLEAMIYIYRQVEGENDNTKNILNEIINKANYAMTLTNKCKEFKMCLDLIENMIYKLNYSIKNDIETQIEVVFMPYKVSMWDCMESVWKEAKNDPNCNCYVVPIPYYELDSEGYINEFCYEGNEFSDDIEVTHYSLYDLENRKPDVIYIHNPYDEANRLTRVDSRHFSKNLLKHTNMLVYIPYFVAGSYLDLMDKRHFSELPGVINATKVIVQSDVEKDLYVASGNDFNKVLNLGSPKFDATISSMKKSFKDAKKWQEIINNKKVFLLNTGITNLLENGKKWMEDMNKILDTFIMYDSCCLIWRQHPLTVRTIKTMRQELMGLFNNYLEKISNVENVIIDLNSDVYPAISVSDALISDYSSVMFQYMATEKPVLGMIEESLIEENRIYAIDYLGNYFVNKDMNVEKFINMVINGEDPKKEERIKRLKASITNLDGECGKRVHETIKKEAIESILS